MARVPPDLRRVFRMNFLKNQYFAVKSGPYVSTDIKESELVVDRADKSKPAGGRRFLRHLNSAGFLRQESMEVTMLFSQSKGRP